MNMRSRPRGVSDTMAFGSLGPGELLILLFLFFLIFGADKLPKVARALGKSKGEFQAGLSETTSLPRSDNTETDLEAGGRTPEQALAADAEAAGVDPAGMDTESVREAIEDAGEDNAEDEQADTDE